MITLEKIIAQTHELENKNIIELDDIIHKVTQEIGEVLEAVQWWNPQEIIDEIGDAISNILSVHNRLLGTLPELTKSTNSTTMDIAIQSYKRNDTIQKYRGRYSRSSKTSTEVTQETQTIIAMLQWLAEQYTNSVDITELCQHTLDKFNGREQSYNPKIELESFIRRIKHNNVDFKDIAPLLANNKAFKRSILQLSKQVQEADIIACFDARWFIFGAPVAIQTGKPLVMIRKSGKLPWEVISTAYTKEYEKDSKGEKQEIQKNSIQSWQKVALIDDVLATGGTTKAWCQLIEQLGGTVSWCHFVMWLNYLPGKEVLKDYPITTLVEY